MNFCLKNVVWRNWFIVFAILLFICLRCVAHRQKKPLQLTYSQKNTLIAAFLAETSIRKMQFRPYTYGVHAWL